MKSSIPYTFNSNSITFFLKGKQRTFASDHPNFSEIKAAVVAGDVEKIELLSDVAKVVTKATLGSVIIDTDDNVRFNGELVPEYLATRILKHYEEDPELVAPLIAFAEKLMGNPAVDVRNDLYRWLEAGKMPIFPDGDFMAYKLVREDFSPINKGGKYGKDQSPGQIVEQPRETCNSNRNDTCSSGLHFCSYSYLPTFQEWNDYRGNRVIMLKINPADVVAIPTDYNLSKGRTCRFEVIAEIDRETLREEFGNRLIINEPKIAKKESKASYDAVTGGIVYEKSRTVDEVAKTRNKENAEKAVAAANGNKTAAAKALGIGRSTLYDWLRG